MSEPKAQLIPKRYCSDCWHDHPYNKPHFTGDKIDRALRKMEKRPR